MRGWRLAAAIAGGTAVVIAGVVAVVVWNQPDAEPAPTAAPPAAVRSETPTPSPAPTTPRVAVSPEDLDALPVLDVFTVDDRLPVDSDPHARFTGSVAAPTSHRLAVFATPGGEPLFALESPSRFGGTHVPVVSEEGDWLEVLLVGRASLPSDGESRQVRGWVQRGDVSVTNYDATVRVDLADGTISILRDGSSELLTEDFAFGTDVTPTPVGRTFVMHTEVVPDLQYTQGHPIVYLAAQSPTLDGFDGQNVAVTAFHYHDEHSGAISNGCIRVDAQTITALAELPLGTPVEVVE